jgi:hypothetical protein
MSFREIDYTAALFARECTLAGAQEKAQEHDLSLDGGYYAESAIKSLHQIANALGYNLVKLKQVEEDMTRPDWIKTSHICPPIPFRGHDWCAYDDRLGEDASPYGWGETEDEAIADLLEQMEDAE